MQWVWAVLQLYFYLRVMFVPETYEEQWSKSLVLWFQGKFTTAFNHDRWWYLPPNCKSHLSIPCHSWVDSWYVSTGFTPCGVPRNCKRFDPKLTSGLAWSWPSGWSWYEYWWPTTILFPWNAQGLQLRKVSYLVFVWHPNLNLGNKRFVWRLVHFIPKI